MFRTIGNAVPLLALSATALGLNEARQAEVNLAASLTPAGYSDCLFYDDFSVTSNGYLPDDSKWSVDLGTRYHETGPKHWGTGEIQVYTDKKANLRVTEDKTLKITPLRNFASNGTWSWTSARIETKADWDFACPEGGRLRVESRMKLGDNAKSVSLGIWPAFWLLGGSYRKDYFSWPGVGEIDVMESVNGLDKVFHTLHCGTYPDGVCSEPSGVGHEGLHLERRSWHTIGVEFDRRPALGSGNQSITFLVDGKASWSISESKLTSNTSIEQSTVDAAWNSLVANPMMILLNVAVGGAMPNAKAGIFTPTNKTIGGDGASLEVDYVAVWSSHK